MATPEQIKNKYTEISERIYGIAKAMPAEEISSPWRADHEGPIPMKDKIREYIASRLPGVEIGEKNASKGPFSGNIRSHAIYCDIGGEKTKIGTLRLHHSPYDVRVRVLLFTRNLEGDRWPYKMRVVDGCEPGDPDERRFGYWVDEF